MAHPRRILSRFEISPKKSLGQNFLYDDNLLAKIAGAADLTLADRVLEIGPGVGALTRHLARSAGSVVAVELDQRLKPVLREQLAEYENVELVWTDILSLSPCDFIDGPYKVVANIPYYITGALLRHLFADPCPPSLLVLTVQKEIAERMTASPGDMSLLAVTVQFYCLVSGLFVIRAGAFWPRPEVDSAVVRLRLRQERLLEVGEEAAFFQVVRAGFSQKRKQLQNSLRSLGGSGARIQAALAMADVEGTSRAQELTLNQWLAIYRALL